MFCVVLPTQRGLILTCVMFDDEIERLKTCDPPSVSGSDLAAAMPTMGFMAGAENLPFHTVDFMIAYEPDREEFLAWMTSANRTALELLTRLERGHVDKPGDGRLTNYSEFLNMPTDGIKQ